MAVPRRPDTDVEEVIVRLRPHWTYLGWAPSIVLLAGVLLITAFVAWPSAPVAVGDLLLIAVVGCALWLGGRMVRWSTTSVVLTEGRLLQRSGVIARRGVDVRLERIHEISYQQAIWQRLLGTGTLFVDVGGERGIIRFDHVRRPARVASAVHEQIDGRSVPDSGYGHVRSWPGRSLPSADPVAYRDPDDTPPTGTPAVPMGSAAQRLIELDELRRRGLLSDEEFAERKARLLEQL